MHRSAAAVAKAVGWLLVLCVPWLLVGALFAPRAVQAFNPVVCGRVGHLDNRGVVSDGSGQQSSSIELVCRGQGRYDNVTARIVLTLFVLIALAFVTFFLAARLLRAHDRVPGEIARR